MAPDRPADLLAGPRGRRLCLSLVHGGASWVWPPRGVREPWSALSDAVRSAPLPDLSEDLLWSALVDAVDTARYWQEPDQTDDLLTHPTAGRLLAPVAEAVAACPATAWWWTDVETSSQVAVSWPGTGDQLPARPPAGDRRSARAWTEGTAAEELRAARERPQDPTASWSGCWWSAPCLSGLAQTTRTRPSSPRVGAAPVWPLRTPVGLELVEDELGWETARTWPMRPAAGIRVLKVRDAADWAALVARHPLPVTAARRHDWYRCTGRVGEWVVADWGAVAEEVDGVHLPVAAWLSLAGRAVDVPGTGAATVLAGWGPDTTWWCHGADGFGDPTDWTRTEEDPPDRWRPTPPADQAAGPVSPP